MRIELVALASDLPPTSEGRRAASQAIAMEMRSAATDEDMTSFLQPVEVRIRITAGIWAAAAGDTGNIVLQQQDPVSGLWHDVPTRVEGDTLVTDTTSTGRIVVSVPGPPPQPEQEVMVMVPGTTWEMVMPPPKPGVGAPIIQANESVVSDYYYLVYLPRERSQIPDMGALAPVGEPFQLEAYRLDHLLHGFRFDNPIDVFVPFTKEMLAAVDQDPDRLRVVYWDEAGEVWVAVKVDVLEDGLHVAVDHLTLFAIAGVRAAGEAVDKGRAASAYTASVFDRSFASRVGDPINIEVMLDTADYPPLDSDLVVTYPADLLEVRSIQKQDSVCSTDLDISREPGRLRLRCAVERVTSWEAPGRIATVVFTGLKPGEGQVEVSNDSRAMSQALQKDILALVGGVKVYVDVPIPGVEQPPQVRPLPMPTPTPAPTPTPTPTLAPGVTPPPTPAPTPPPSPTPTPGPTTTPTAVPPVGTPTPTNSAPVGETVAGPPPTPPPGALGEGAKTSGDGAPTPNADGARGGADRAPKTLGPGSVASVLDVADTSTTVGNTPVSGEVARARGEMRKLAIGGGALTARFLPLFVTQSVDLRTIIGTLLAGGAFLPFLFLGGGRLRRAPGGGPRERGEPTEDWSEGEAPEEPEMEGDIVKRIWPVVAMVFFLGVVLTAAALTVVKSDLLAMAGMGFSVVGVLGMWVVEIESVTRRHMLVALLFIVGSLAMIAAVTVAPSNPLLMISMLISGSAVLGMWSVDKKGWFASTVSGVFIVGIAMEALGLTVMPSDLLIMIGMVFLGAGVVGMWMHERVTG